MAGLIVRGTELAYHGNGTRRYSQWWIHFPLTILDRVAFWFLTKCAWSRLGVGMILPHKGDILSGRLVYTAVLGLEQARPVWPAHITGCYRILYIKLVVTCSLPKVWHRAVQEPRCWSGLLDCQQTGREGVLSNCPTGAFHDWSCSWPCPGTTSVISWHGKITTIMYVYNISNKALGVGCTHTGLFCCRT